MKTALLLTALLVLGTVAVAPTASAGHYCNFIRDPPQACYAADGVLHDATDYANCYWNTPPRDWAATCV